MNDWVFKHMKHFPVNIKQNHIEVGFSAVESISLRDTPFLLCFPNSLLLLIATDQVPMIHWHLGMVKANYTTLAGLIDSWGWCSPRTGLP